MNIEFMKINNDQIKNDYVEDICDFFNYHRKLTNAPKHMWQTMEQSRQTLEYWIKEGEFCIINIDQEQAGFIYYEFLNETFVRLEDLFLKEEYRGKGLGKQCLTILDNKLKSKGVIACSVNVIPKNTSAINFYIDCGFDHLNMIEIRKNYDKKFDRDEEIEILGFKLKKY